ncbi:MAG: hypothetical protein KAI66_10875 [Lentisphaeria bacterium]|nr:hypothetical protein [Lentisphaeria bacterium]
MSTQTAQTLHQLGEHFAAGYFELPDATPVRRWSRAVRRRFEHRRIPPYDGTRLFPAGQNTDGAQNRIVAASYSFTWSYQHAQTENIAPDPDEKQQDALAELAADMERLAKETDCIHTPHTAGGRGYTHSVPHYGRVLREGLDSYETRVAKRLTQARACNDNQAVDLLMGLLDVLAGIRAWHANIVAALRKHAPADEPERARRERLVQALEQVPFQPARSFFEAIVAYNLVFYMDECDNPGRVDYELDPYFSQDERKGLTDPEEAEALLRELWVNTDANSGWSASIGGSLPDGQPAYNPLTQACLRAARGMRRPNLQLRIRHDMPDQVWEEALNTLETGTGLPALHNEEEYIRSLRGAHLGIRSEDFALVNGAGCTETLIHGHSNVGSLDAGLNLPLVLVDTLERHLATTSSFEHLLEAFKNDLRGAVREIADHVNRDQEAKARWRPQPMRSLLMDDCIDNGIEYNAGGARYNWSVINVAGLANMVDSLTAVREMVFEQKRLSGGELARALRDDFEGAEPLRRQLAQCSKFGNDHVKTDELARHLADFVFRELLAHAPWRGGKFLGSCLMFVTYVAAGKGVGATPDGRRAGAPIADSAGPMQGCDRNGPTAMIKSLGTIPHHLAPGTLVVNARFGKALFTTPAERKKLRALVRSYFDLGGMQIQINVVDQKLLRDAVDHPDNYPNLVVRMGGYSEYFCRLTPELRQTLLERTEHTM